MNLAIPFQPFSNNMLRPGEIVITNSGWNLIGTNIEVPTQFIVCDTNVTAPKQPVVSWKFTGGASGVWKINGTTDSTTIFNKVLKNEGFWSYCE